MVACLGRAQLCCPFQRHTVAHFLLPFPLQLPFKFVLPFAGAHYTHLSLLQLPFVLSFCPSPWHLLYAFRLVCFCLCLWL